MGSCIAGPGAYIKASNTEGGDWFGWNLALSADGNTLAVGAYTEDSNATGINGNQADNSTLGAGAVYVFTRNGTMWSQQAYIKASNPNGTDNFGVSVALSADGNTLAVGAPGESSNATGINGNQADNSLAESGAVYVFTRSGTSWSQQAYIKASNPDAYDQLGAMVALSWNGDTLAVGAPDYFDTDVGAAYVFTRSGTTWSQQAYIEASNGYNTDYFGQSVALSGDGNTLAVGAYGEDSNATGINGNQADNSANNSGAAYVFIRSGTTWLQQAYVKASNTEAGDEFGKTLTLSGDGNTLAVGAYGEDSNATGVNGDQNNNSLGQSGAVYVFMRSGGTWSQQSYIKGSGTDTVDLFGLFVALSGDGNTLAVDAPREDSNATSINGNQADNSAPESGAVYVFTRNGATWSQQIYAKASNTNADDRFGACALSADGRTLAVGAYQEDSNATGINGNQIDNSATDSGAVYVY